MKKLYLIFIMILSFSFLFVGCNDKEEEKKIDYDSHKYFIYELASKSGYNGSYDEWLKSIKGDNDNPVEITMIDTALCWRYVGDEYFIPLYDLSSSLNDGDDKIKPDEKEECKNNCDTTESAYQIYIKHFPDYNKTEEEWLDDLLNGRLSSSSEDNTKVVEIEPESITISGEDEMFIGYKQQLIYSVLPLECDQSVIWSSNNDEVATVDENGIVTSLSFGDVKIKATSTVNSNVSATFRIKVGACDDFPIPNMGGYEIVIMNAVSALSDDDPFLDTYSNPDKVYKQKAWREIEETYNCKISVVSYPEEAPWGEPRINWIKDKASTNTSQCDLAVISSNYVPELAKTFSAINISEYYRIYGRKQMDPALKQAGTYHGGLYIASTGTTTTAVNVDIGLYYNYGLLKRLGIEDPAKLFNDGNWNYTGFEKWVHEAQEKLGDNRRALGGQPYYYYYGMTNAAGVQIIDVILNTTNIRSEASRNAMKLMAKLTQDGCVSTGNTWGDKGSYEGNDFFDEGVLMITGLLWYVGASSRWSSQSLHWEGTPEIAYVPFPYPDNVNKTDTRIGTCGLSVYLYVAGRKYPSGISSEFVYVAMNDLFLRTHKYQNNDETFNAEDFIYNSLKKRISNDASIEAMMYYDSSRVFYDPAHTIYQSTAGSCLRQPSIDVMFGAKDFDETFGNVEAQFEEDFLKVYG